MAITLDSSTPAFATGTANPITTASFTPPAGSLLIAFAEADESNTFSISGGGLTWTPLDTVGVTARNSLASWWAIGAGASMTVSVTKTGSFTANAVKVLVFAGAEASFTGAHGVAQSNTITLTGTQTGSWMWAAIGDNLGSTSDAAGTGCTYNDAEVSFGGVSGGILKRTSQDGVSGAGTTLSAGSSSTDMSIIAVEIKAPSAPGGPALPRAIAPGFTPFGQARPWQGTSSSTNASIQASISDNAAATDTVARIVILTRPLSDTAAASDVVVRVLVESRPVADTAAAADTLTRVAAEARSAADTAAAADAAARVLTAARSIADTAAATDALSRAAALARSITDTAAAVDAAVRTGTRARGVDDTAPASDTVTRAATYNRTTSDSAPAGDAVARGLTLTRAAADPAAASDAITRTETAARSVADSAPATDTVTASTGGHAARDISDTAAATDAATRQVSLPRAVADTAPAADAASASSTRSRAVADTAAASDAVTRSAGKPRAVADSAPASDAIGRIGTHGRAVSDAASAGDGIVRMVVISRAVADASPASDAVGWLQGRARSVSDSAPAVDLVTWRATSTRPIGDTALAADSVDFLLKLIGSPAAPSARNGWGSLLSIVREASGLLEDELVREPTACPDCGEPLRTSVHGATFCPNDGSEWAAGGRRTLSPPTRPDLPANPELSQDPVSCLDCGEPLTTGPNGEQYCQFDGQIWATGNRRAGLVGSTHN